LGNTDTEGFDHDRLSRTNDFCSEFRHQPKAPASRERPYLEWTPGDEEQGSCSIDRAQHHVHEPGTSHFELLEGFAPRRLLERAMAHAARTGYLQHEFGDSCLVLPGALLERLAA
jgi:hypothetical protein